MTGSRSPLRAISVRSRPNALSAGVLTSPFFSGAGAGAFSRGLGNGRFLAGEIRIQLLQNFLPRLLDVHVEIFEHLGGDAVAFAEQAEQDVFGADVGVIERLGFLGGEGQHFFHARRVGNVPDHFLVGAGADLFLDLHADGFEVEAHFLEHVDGDALPQFDQAEQQMFGAEEVVVEPVGFLARQREHLLRARREIAHGFVAHIRFILLLIGRFVQSRSRRAEMFCHRPAHVFQTLAHHVGADQIAFLGGQFVGKLFLQMRRLRQDEQLIHQRHVPRPETSPSPRPAA